MSSFVGHGLAALTVGVSRADARSPAQRALWCAALVACAWAPDIDYVVAIPGTASDPSARLSHSLLAALALPASLSLALFLAGLRGPRLRPRVVELALAGLSHPALDLLVGVTPLPLAWPLSDALFRLPFGVLPSAGALRLRNPLFWRNLALEAGVLVPWAALAVALGRGALARSRVRAILLGLATLSVACAYTASQLARPR